MGSGEFYQRPLSTPALPKMVPCSSQNGSRLYVEPDFCVQGMTSIPLLSSPLEIYPSFTAQNLEGGQELVPLTIGAIGIPCSFHQKTGHLLMSPFLI